MEDRLRKNGKPTDTTYYYPDNAVGNAEEDVYYEHAHWKYKYDHSKLKPHVDKLLAAIGRMGQKQQEKKKAKAEKKQAETKQAEKKQAEEAAKSNAADDTKDGE